MVTVFWWRPLVVKGGVLKFLLEGRISDEWWIRLLLVRARKGECQVVDHEWPGGGWLDGAVAGLTLHLKSPCESQALGHVVSFLKI